jgi:RimJ/RimL family protein N-acetyltransferase
MNPKLLTGELVHLTAEDSKFMAEKLSQWCRDSEYWRLMAGDPARLFSVKAIEKWFEESNEKDVLRSIYFGIRTLENERLIGEIGLDEINWIHRSSYVGISIGERHDWGKGYGTDAMRVMLRYAFAELNLHRVNLTVFDYNPRAIRSYQKAGFVEEGRSRQELHREGRRWDVIYMGILRSEWEKLYEYPLA